MEIAWKKFNAMGTEIIVAAVLEPEQKELLDEAERVIVDFEKRFSRFIQGNELYHLNNAVEHTIEGSDLMVDILGEAKRMHEETQGVFDPTIIGSLEKVGYDRTFAEVQADKARERGVIDVERIRMDFSARPSMQDIKIEGRTIVAPKGFRLDFGGIGKGYIVDLLGRTVFKDIQSYWISAGGDLLVSGNDLEKEGWKIAIQDPLTQGGEIFSVKTKGEKLGIATSGVLARRGHTGDFEWSHLIDPRTGLPVKNDIIAVTIISSTAERADVFAKTVLILGREAGLEFVERTGDSVCIIFFKDEAPLFSPGVLKYI